MFDFKSATWEDAKVEFARLAKECGDDSFGTKKELKALPELLRAGEPVLALASGMVEANTWLIALTDRRIIFLDKGMLYGMKQEIVPLDKVNSIAGSTGMMFGKIVITDGAGDRVISQVPKKTVQPFTARAMEAMEAMKNGGAGAPTAGGGDELDKLERLAALHEKGLLDNEEFRAAKAKILGG